MEPHYSLSLDGYRLCWCESCLGRLERGLAVQLGHGFRTRPLRLRHKLQQFLPPDARWRRELPCLGSVHGGLQRPRRRWVLVTRRGRHEWGRSLSRFGCRVALVLMETIGIQTDHHRVWCGHHRHGRQRLRQTQSRRKSDLYARLFHVERHQLEPHAAHDRFLRPDVSSTNFRILSGQVLTRRPPDRRAETTPLTTRRATRPSHDSISISPAPPCSASSWP